MNHQPFEDWLLSDSPLAPADRRLLEAHLRECRACAALAEVNLALQSARPVSPPPGFVERFRQRLAARRQSQRKALASGFLLLIASAVGIVAALSWPLLNVLLDSPTRAIVEWTYSLVSVYTLFQAFCETIRVLVRVGTSLISPAFWTLSFLSLGMICLLGIASLAKFTRIPQGVRL